MWRVPENPVPHSHQTRSCGHAQLLPPLLRLHLRCPNSHPGLPDEHSEKHWTDDFHWPLVQIPTLLAEMRKNRYNLGQQLHKSTLGIPSLMFLIPLFSQELIILLNWKWWLLPQTHRLHPWLQLTTWCPAVGRIYVNTWLWASTWEQWRHVFTQCRNSITYTTFLTPLLVQSLLAHPTCASLPAHDPRIVGCYSCQLSM